MYAGKGGGESIQNRDILSLRCVQGEGRGVKYWAYLSVRTLWIVPKSSVT